MIFMITQLPNYSIYPITFFSVDRYGLGTAFSQLTFAWLMAAVLAGK